jgi:hypothetical protein
MNMKSYKLGRNESCYCGSGQKYKRCCLITDGHHFENDDVKEKSILFKNGEYLRERVQNELGGLVLQGEINGIKMSEVIIELADFLLEQAHTEDRIRTAITITCTAWNIALLGFENAPKFLDPKQINDPMVKQDVLDIINVIIEKKQACYPEINRIILDFDMVKTKSNLHINVVSTVLESDVNMKRKTILEL